MAQSIVLIGGAGFAGGNLALVAARGGWEVHVAGRHGRPASLPAAIRYHELSATEEPAVRRVLEQVRPGAVVDLAAVADIDRAEREPEIARSVNVEAAAVIAAACAAIGAWCLYFSSDAVFDGTAERYVEEDQPHPLSVYGKTKADGERAVLERCPGAGVVRSSLILGFPVTAGNSAFAALEARLRKGEEIVAPRDEVRTPIDVLTLSACVLELARLRFSGVLHLGATDSRDRAAIARRAADLMGFPNPRIQTDPVPAGAGRAPRHKNGIISVAKAQRILTTPLLDTERSIQKAIRERLV